MDFDWDNHWAALETEITGRYASIRHKFETTTKSGKKAPFSNWSGKSIRQMAEEVDHIEAYDMYYSQLSSFTHGDVHLADRFLTRGDDGVYWSVKTNEVEVGSVFRYAAVFLSCMLKFMAREFGQWSEEDVERCWGVEPGDRENIAWVGN